MIFPVHILVAFPVLFVNLQVLLVLQGPPPAFLESSVCHFLYLLPLTLFSSVILKCGPLLLFRIISLQTFVLLNFTVKQDSVALGSKPIDLFAVVVPVS